MPLSQPKIYYNRGQILYEYDVISAANTGSFTSAGWTMGTGLHRTTTSGAVISNILLTEVSTSPSYGYYIVKGYNADMSGTVNTTLNLHSVGCRWITDLVFDRVTNEMIAVEGNLSKSPKQMWRFDGVSSTLNRKQFFPFGTDNFVQDVAIDHSDGKHDLLLAGKDGLIHHMVGSSDTVQAIYNANDVEPGIYTIAIAVDDAGNLLLSTYNDYIYVMNGMSMDVLDMITLPTGLREFQWYGDVIKYDPITGYPDVDGIMGVIGGCWQDPLTENYTHGLYVQEVVKVAKLLGYTGSERAAIIQAAARSIVNISGCG